MANPTAAMLVIGDEILSGRTQDTNTNYLAVQLTEAAIDLREVRVVSDVHDSIVDAVRQLSGRYDYVFTSGGIGPTHDDITADAIAGAFGVHVDVRDDARALMQAHSDKTGRELNEARLRMARIPDGATLIDNPVSVAPGFKLENVRVMAGVPSVFKAMVAAVLPTLSGGSQVLSVTFRVERPEGDVAGPLADFADRNPDISVGSYPFSDAGIYGCNIVLRDTQKDRLAVAADQFAGLFEEAIKQ